MDNRQKPSRNDVNLLFKKAKSAKASIQENQEAISEARKILDEDEVELTLAKYEIDERNIKAVEKIVGELETIKGIVDETLSLKSYRLGSPASVEAFNRATAAHMIGYQIPSITRQRLKLIHTLSDKFFYGERWFKIFTKEKGPIGEKTKTSFIKSIPVNYLLFWRSGHVIKDPSYRQKEISALSVALKKSVNAAAKEEKLPLKLKNRVDQYSKEKNIDHKKTLLKEIEYLSKCCSSTELDKDGVSALQLAESLKDEALLGILKSAVEPKSSFGKR